MAPRLTGTPRGFGSGETTRPDPPCRGPARLRPSESGRSGFRREDMAAGKDGAGKDGASGVTLTSSPPWHSFFESRRGGRILDASVNLFLVQRPILDLGGCG